ncbi:MAG: NYN domain-containing protein [Patescibacteria group bacterium]
MLLIDGYNLFHNTNFENQSELIFALDKYADRFNKKIKVVFDGFCPNDLSTYLVNVEFAGDADARIMEILEHSTNPADYVIITSDREIALFARGKRCQVIKSENFNFSIYEIKNDDLVKSENVFLSDEEVKRQLREFNNFKKSAN